MLTSPSLGFGLGLRVDHYEAILGDRPPVDWFEVLTENYLVPGGKPLSYLMRFRERYPLALLTPKTHLFLNSTFANGRRQHAAQPEPFVVIHPDDATPRGIADGAVVRVGNGRGSFTCRAVVSDDARAGVPVAPMGWWNRDYPGGRSPQATTPQRLTTLRDAPTFNDNRVEIEPA